MRDTLISARQANKLTQEKIAQKLGISRSFYSLIETGARNPSRELARILAKQLKKPIRKLFFDYLCFNLKQKCSKGHRFTHTSKE